MSPKKPQRYGRPVPEPKNVPASAGRIDKLKLIIVKTKEHMQIWNELMIAEHPRGAGPLVGRQIRYLIGSEYGYLGGISFSSSALHLDARDRWIGWNWEAHQENLHHIVNMSR